MPSCQTFCADAVTLDGTKAPVSIWWPLVTAQNRCSPSTKTGQAVTRSPTCVLNRYGSLQR